MGDRLRATVTDPARTVDVCSESPPGHRHGPMAAAAAGSLARDRDG